jgi:ribonuclease BN (tRNA processing enzyme)
VRIALLGVRGSTPAPGHDFAGYGGHTSCVAVFNAADEVPRLVLDAGTGLRTLPRLLAGRPFAGDLVLSHLHWDHVQGLPFCPSVDNPDAQVTLHLPVSPDDTDPVALLARTMSPPHFPIGPDGLLGDWRFTPMTASTFEVAGGSVTIAPVEHKGGVCFGIRIEMDGAILVYLPDHALTGEHGGATDSALSLARGADLLLHDGQYLAAEIAVARAYGHATIEAAAMFADLCGVGELILTHHSPARTDDELDQLAGIHRRTPGGIPVRFARQDAVVPVGRID